MPKDTKPNKQSLIHDVMPSLQSLNFKEMRKSKGLTLSGVDCRVALAKQKHY